MYVVYPCSFELSSVIHSCWLSRITSVKFDSVWFVWAMTCTNTSVDMYFINWSRYMIVCSAANPGPREVKCVCLCHHSGHNVLHKRAGHTSGPVKTRAWRVFCLLLLITQQSLVIMPSETEGRISLALQAYISNQIPSLRAIANAYDVPFITLRERHLRVLLRKETTPNSRKFSNNKEEVLLRKIL